MKRVIEAVDSTYVKFGTVAFSKDPPGDAYQAIHSAALAYSTVAQFKAVLIDESGVAHRVSPGIISTFTDFVFRRVGVGHAGLITIITDCGTMEPPRSAFDRLKNVPKLLLPDGRVMCLFRDGQFLGNFHGEVAGLGMVHSVGTTWDQTEVLELPPSPGTGTWIERPHNFVQNLPIAALLAIKDAQR